MTRLTRQTLPDKGQKVVKRNKDLPTCAVDKFLTLPSLEFFCTEASKKSFAANMFHLRVTLRVCSRWSSRCYSNGAADKFPAIKTPLLPPNFMAGRSAFITGGGTGLGRGITEVLSALGATVVISSR